MEIIVYSSHDAGRTRSRRSCRHPARGNAPVAIGALVGVALCAIVSPILSSLLFGVSPVDLVAYGSVAAFLLSVALLAS